MNSRKREEERNNIIKNAIEMVKEDKAVHLTVEAVAKKSNIAKGTFYLFFNNKEELEMEIMERLSYELLVNSFNKSREFHGEAIDQFINFLDLIIKEMEENHNLLYFISSRLSLGIVRRMDRNLETDDWKEKKRKLKELLTTFKEDFAFSDMNEAKQELYFLIEMVGGVCRNAILDDYPTNIEEMKPLIFKNVRKMLKV